MAGQAEPTPEQPANTPAGVTPPRLLESSELELPAGAEAPADGLDVLLSIDAQGRVTDAEALQALQGDIEEALVEAALRLRFAPALRDGEPVESRVGFRFSVAPPSAGGAEGADSNGALLPAAAEPSVPEPPPEASFGATARVDKPEPGAASTVKLRGRELTNIPGTFGDPLRVVATLPGVARTPFGLGFFVVRGANFQNTGFLVDGYPVPLLYHLGAGPAIIPPRLVNSLTFYPGGYPAAYGRFTAGIVSLQTAPPPTDGPYLEFEVDLLRASALTVVPFSDGQGSVALAVRRSYFELLLPLVTDDVSLAYTDYQLRLDYRFSDKLRASLFFFGSRDELEVSGSEGQGETTGSSEAGLRYRFDQIIGKLEWQPRRRVVLSWSATAGPSGIDFGSSSPGSANPSANTDSLRLGQRLQATVITHDDWQTTLGIEQNVFITEAVGSLPASAELPGIPAPEDLPGTVDLSERIYELTMAPYVEQVWRPGPFEITGALRMEYMHYGDVQVWSPDPRAVVRYHLMDSTTLKVATGLFSQPPLPFQLARDFANPALAPNRAWQNSVGAELRLPGSFEIDSTLYYSRMWQLTRASSQLAVDDDGSVSRQFLADDGKGRAYGWELLLRRRAKQGFFGWLSYTLSRSERFLDGGDTAVFGFDQTHVLNLAASYGLKRWIFGARFTLASGRPVTDNSANATGSNVVYDADEDRFRAEPGGARTRLPTFHQMDVRIDRLWTLGPIEGSVFLDVINVYNAANSEGYDYEYDYSRRVRVPGLPFLPTIGVSGVIQ